MKAKLVVFENDKERAMKCADFGHRWEDQQNIFGSETQKLLDACEKLFHASLYHQGKEIENQLLKKSLALPRHMDSKLHGMELEVVASLIDFLYQARDLKY